MFRKFLIILSIASGLGAQARIRKGQLSTGVQTSLDKADTAIQSITDGILPSFVTRDAELESVRLSLQSSVDSINLRLTSDDLTLDELQEIVNFIKQNKALIQALNISGVSGLQAALDLKTNDSELATVAKSGLFTDLNGQIASSQIASNSVTNGKIQSVDFTKVTGLNNVPDGGLTGQALVKDSVTDGDYSWQSISSGGTVALERFKAFGSDNTTYTSTTAVVLDGWASPSVTNGIYSWNASTGVLTFNQNGDYLILATITTIDDARNSTKLQLQRDSGSGFNSIGEFNVYHADGTTGAESSGTLNEAFSFNSGDKIRLTASLNKPNAGETCTVQGLLSSLQVISLKGIKGDKGDTGDQGAQGIQGIQGETGAQGTQGIQGIPGNDGQDGADGLGVPTGGASGQVLAKASNADNDTEWVNAASGTGSGELIDDTSPQLGGNLDTLGRSITTSTGNLVLDGDIVINGASKLRAFNIKGAGINGRLSIQGNAGDNPGIELTTNGNSSRALVRLNEVGTNGVELEVFTEPDGGSIQQALKISDGGSVNMLNHQVRNVADPTLDQDAATKAYVDANAGGTQQYSLTMPSFNFNPSGTWFRANEELVPAIIVNQFGNIYFCKLESELPASINIYTADYKNLNLLKPHKENFTIKKISLALNFTYTVPAVSSGQTYNNDFTYVKNFKLYKLRKSSGFNFDVTEIYSNQIISSSVTQTGTTFGYPTNNFDFDVDINVTDCDMLLMSIANDNQEDIYIENPSGGQRSVTTKFTFNGGVLIYE
jgi:hypothetical protein